VRAAVILLEKVDFTYTSGVQVLDSLDFILSEGAKTGIIGPNGSGKTTMLHIIMGLLKPTSGQVVLFGKPRTSEDDFREARRRIGFVFQDADDQLFCPTVAEDVGFGPRNLGHTARETHEIIHRTLDLLSIGHLEHRVTYQLSGGEKRLVALATALAMEPEVLILDEPTSGLTDEATENLQDILRRHAPSLVVVSQDWQFLDNCVENILTLECGKLNQQAP
jgi:cobalt/nickel transport system ATP-binding protein